MSVRKTIVSNTAFNAVGRVWEALINLVLAAYIIPRVGLAGWGLWALVGDFTGYVGIFDFGLASGFSKYIAEHRARGEERELSSVVSTGFFAYLALGAVLVFLIWPNVDVFLRVAAWLSPERAQWVNDTAFVGDVRLLLCGGLVLFAASSCVSAFSSIQIGLQRMGIANVVSFCASLIKAGATVAFLETGHGIRGLLYASAVVFCFFALTSVVIAFRLVPGLRMSLGMVSGATLRKLFSYGWRTQVSRLSNLITFQTDRIVVGMVYQKLGLVGLYRIGEELSSKMRQAPALLLSAIIPAASDLDARGDEDRLRKLYVLSSKYVAAITLPLVAFCVGCAGPLIRTWMGDLPGLDTAVWVTRIIAFGYLANIIPGAGVSIVLGMGRPDVQMKAGLIAMVSNIVLTVFLVFTVGFYGVALGTAVSMFLSCAWFLAAMRNVIGIGISKISKISMLWPTVASLPGFLVCVLLDCASADLTGRWANGGVVVAGAAIFATAYLAVLRVTPFLDAYDVEFLGKTLGFERFPGFRVYMKRVSYHG